MLDGPADVDANDADVAEWSIRPNAPSLLIARIPSRGDAGHDDDCTDANLERIVLDFRLNIPVFVSVLHSPVEKSIDNRDTKAYG